MAPTSSEPAVKRFGFMSQISPDGQYVVTSIGAPGAAEARAPYPPGAKKPEYPDDPNETQIQYDLYRIPFNDGKGGKAEPVTGASANGMSNSFPKVSPDGRWIVFVGTQRSAYATRQQAYIVPFGGGTARRRNRISRS